MGDIKLTRFEMEVMDAMWQLGSAASVREIQEVLPAKKELAYTTIQTIVYRLEEKGAVRRVKKIGNAFLFEPAITRKAIHHRLFDELLDLFGGSVRPLMSHLLETKKLTLDDVRELEEQLEKMVDDESPAKPATADSETSHASETSPAIETGSLTTETELKRAAKRARSSKTKIEPAAKSEKAAKTGKSERKR